MCRGEMSIAHRNQQGPVDLRGGDFGFVQEQEVLIVFEVSPRGSAEDSEIRQCYFPTLHDDLRGQAAVGGAVTESAGVAVAGFKGRSSTRIIVVKPSDLFDL